MRRRALSKVAVTHGTTSRRLRFIILEGFACPAEPTAHLKPGKQRRFQMRPGEKVDAAFGRFIDTFPPIVAAEDALELRSGLFAFGYLHTEIPERFLEEGLLLLQKESGRVPGMPVAARDLSNLTGANHGQVTKYLAKLAYAPKSEGHQSPAGWTWTPLKRLAFALGKTPRDIRILAQLGLVSMQGHHPEYVDIAYADALETLKARFLNFAPDNIRITDFNLYSKARQMLCIPPDHQHSDIFLNRVIDWLLEHKQKPSLVQIAELIGGSRIQIAEALRRRFKAGDNVVPPLMRPGQTTVDMEDLRAILPDPLKHAFRTVLDPDISSSSYLPRTVDIVNILENQHPVLREIAAIVALSGYSNDGYERLRHSASVALRAFWKPMLGADPRNPADVRRMLEAQFVLATSMQGVERRRVLNSIVSWPAVVTIFTEYRLRENMPDEQAEYLSSIAPVMPLGDMAVIKKARTELAQEKETARVDRVRRLSHTLENVSDLYSQIEKRRNVTKAFRRRVWQIVELAQRWGAPNANASISSHFVLVDEQAPEGLRQTIVEFAVHSWEYIYSEARRASSRVACVGPPVPRDAKPWESALRENRYAVEYVSCRHEDGRPAQPPHWFELHIKCMFWPSRELNEEQAAQRFSNLRDLGLSEHLMRKRGLGLGNFSGPKNTMSRHARRLLDMILLPVEEHNHWEAAAAYTISARLDEPVRVSEHLQFSIGDGVDVHIGEDGQQFTIFKAFRKMKVFQHEFMISHESERLAAELLHETSVRKYGGGAIEKVPRPLDANPRAPDFDRYVLAYGDRSLQACQLDLAVAVLTAGLHRIKGREFKILWNRLAKERGMTLEERRVAQGHLNLSTTQIYNPETPADMQKERGLRRDAVTERRRIFLEGTDQIEVRGATELAALNERAADLQSRIRCLEEPAQRSLALREFASVQANITALRTGQRILRSDP